MKTLLISHYYNEEFLMPHWVQHHLGMFDHAVMIDYASTDRSNNIIRRLAPSWEIRPSRNAMFSAPDVDSEVMDVERGFPGWWKVALNLTEFLVMPELDLKHTLANLLDEHPAAFMVASHGMRLIDRGEDFGVPVDDCRPLVLQRHWGLNEVPNYGNVPNTQKTGSRARLVHRLDHGQYFLGRHVSGIEFPHLLPDELYCVWFGWCPYPEVRQRKMQIQHQMPAGHIQNGWGVEHDLPTVESADAQFRRWSAHSRDLYEEESYRQVIESCRGHFPQPYVCGEDARNFTV